MDTNPLACFLNRLFSQMRIALGCPQIRMTEQPRDHLEIDARVHSNRRKTVTQIKDPQISKLRALAHNGPHIGQIN